ncbi:hypothetical protein NHF46_15765 [Arthrobacter alpinus]|nr:hypothetical protein [Arthrobacter alpinus]
MGSLPKATVAGLLGGLGFGAIILGWRMTRIFITPENISQTYDNVFHLNAVRFILDTGNGSSLRLATLDPSGPGSFYPAVWHDLVSLVVQLSGSSIPVGLNAVNLVLGAVVWTISVMYLATRVLGSRPAVYLVTGSLAGAFSAFPYLLLGFGVLYPNFLAITLLPVAVALLTDVLRVSTVSHPGWLRGGILLLVILPGVTLSHPNIAMAFAVFAIPIIAIWLYKQVRACLNHDLAIRWLAASLVATAGYLLALQFAWEKFRPSKEASSWAPRQTIAQALGEGLANAPLGSPYRGRLHCLPSLVYTDCYAVANIFGCLDSCSLGLGYLLSYPASKKGNFGRPLPVSSTMTATGWPHYYR